MLKGFLQQAIRDKIDVVIVQELPKLYNSHIPKGWKLALSHHPLNNEISSAIFISTTNKFDVLNSPDVNINIIKINNQIVCGIYQPPDNTSTID